MIARRIIRQILFARYTPFRQIYSRLWLIGKRSLLSSLPLREQAPALDSAPINRAASPPGSLFPPRRRAEALGMGEYSLRFLNSSKKFKLPFEWHEKSLASGTRLWKLNLHYHEFLESLSPLDAVEIILDWISNNEPFRNQYWMDSWNSYALSIRVVVWMQLLSKVDFIEASTRTIIELSIRRQIEFLLNNLETDIGGNHLIKNIKAILWSSAYFSGNRSKEWRHVGETLLVTEMRTQILHDGFHYELSPSYHCQVFADLLEIRSVLTSDDIRTEVDRSLTLMLGALQDVTHPDGLPSLFGDGGLNMAYPPQQCVEAYEAMIGPAAPSRQTVILKSAGLYGAREQNDFLLVAMGRLGPDQLMAHAHGHWGALEWSIMGRRVIVDQGVFEYNAGVRRDLSRSTSSHNTATVDGLEQADFYSSFRCGARPHPNPATFSHGTSSFTVSGELTLSRAKRCKLSRTVALTSQALTIRDKVLGDAAEGWIEGRLLLHPEIEVVTHQSGISLKRDGSFLLEVRTSPGAELSCEAAEWWPDMGVAIPTCRLVYRGRREVVIELARIVAG